MIPVRRERSRAMFRKGEQIFMKSERKLDYLRVKSFTLSAISRKWWWWRWLDAKRASSLILMTFRSPKEAERRIDESNLNFFVRFALSAKLRSVIPWFRQKTMTNPSSYHALLHCWHKEFNWLDKTIKRVLGNKI